MSKANNKVLTKSGSYIIKARRASDFIIYYLLFIVKKVKKRHTFRYTVSFVLLLFSETGFNKFCKSVNSFLFVCAAGNDSDLSAAHDAK